MKKVVIIGGAVIDLFLYPHEKMILHDSNPGYMRRSFGGVGRNIAENLVRLGIDTTLITALGVDQWGKEVYDHGTDLGMCINSIDVRETPLYVSVIQENGEDLVSVALMDDILQITPDSIKNRSEIIRPADLIVMDTNLPVETIEYVLMHQNKPVYIDVISTQKAIKVKPYLKYIHTLKMNLMEAETLSNIKYQNSQDIEKMGQYFINQGVQEIYMTLGEEGVFYQDQNVIKKIKPILVDVKNSNGAGDAFFSGVIYAKIHEKDPLKAGLANAAINLESNHAVSQILNKTLLENKIKENFL